MSTNIGDAVLTFLGDSSQLDAKFDEVGPNAEKAFGSAAEAGEDAMGRIKSSTKEATGEVALLGEEFGIRLPRHVRSFVASLPGVGEALSTAFSATAVLFLAKALVEATEKATNFAAELLYDKSVHEESEQSVVALNKVLLDLSKQYEEVKKRADDYGKSQLQLAQEQHAQVRQSLADINTQLKIEQVRFMALQQEINVHQKSVVSLSDAYGLWKSGTLSVTEAYKAYLGTLDTTVLKHKELDEVEGVVLQLTKQQAVANQELRVSSQAVATAQADLNKKGEELQKQIAAANEELEKLNERMVAIVAPMRSLAQAEITTLPPIVEHFLAAQKAAQSLGITTRVDLVESLQAARKALQEYYEAGGKDSVVITQFNQKILDAQHALTNFGQTMDSFKLKSNGLWKSVNEDFKSGEVGIHALAQVGVTAFDDLSKNVQNAFQGIVLGQQNVAQALERATAESLAQIASQAAVKAIFYTGEGLAALAGFNAGSASQYFAAAAEMAAVAAVAGVAGRALSGAGGGTSANTQQLHTSQSNTTSSNGGGTSAIGVQAFATGGLISQPTLAMIGEGRRREAVLPLEDSRAMKQIAEAIGSQGGGGLTVHVHGGLVSDDKLVKIMNRMNRLVNKGQATLLSSNSLRVTKRSA